MRKGILVASFGTTFEDTRIKNIDKLVEYVRHDYPEIEVYEAYTSKKIREKLREKYNLIKYSVSEALAKMAKDGITHVYILPTHIIDGIESNKVKTESSEFKDCFDQIKIASALLKSDSDYDAVAEVIWEELKDIVMEDSLILMGHGTEHEADASYRKIENIFREKTGKSIYIATVEGSVTIADVIQKLKTEKDSGRVIVTPFMLVAGDHANNDMAGDEDSFKSRLVENGYEPCCIIKGIGEYEGIRKIYMKHLKDIL